MENIDSGTESEKESLPALKRINTEAAIQAFNVCIQWAEENPVPLADMLALQKLRELAVAKYVECKKTQSKISDFFDKE